MVDTNIHQDSIPTSPILLLPKAYQPSHQRDDSDASSVYSNRRTSVYKPQHGSSDSIESMTDSKRKSITIAANVDDVQRKSQLFAPSSSTDKKADPRFSEFYDSYFRHSMVNSGQTTELPKPFEGMQPGVAM